MNCVQGFEIMADGVFYGYLCWAAWQDHREKMVVRYTHMIGLAAVFLLVYMRKEIILEHILLYVCHVLLICMIQAAAYQWHLYGLADAFVFALCGLFFLAKQGFSGYLSAYLIVFALSGCLMLFVQIYKGNIKGIRLLTPTAYIPYICFAFFLTNVVV